MRHHSSGTADFSFRPIEATTATNTPGSLSTPRSEGDPNAPHVSPITPEEDARTVLINEINWGAVIAGSALALVVQLIVNMVGVSVAGAVLSPTGGDNPTATNFSIGAGLWWAASGIIAAFIGGLAAGRLSGVPKESTAGWHGLTSWAFTTLIIFYLLGSAAGNIGSAVIQTMTSVASGAAQTAGGAVQTATQAVAPALTRAADPFASVEEATRNATGGQDPAALQRAAVSAVRAALTGTEAEINEARQRAAEALARAQNIPVEQARTQIQQYETQYRQAVASAKEQAVRAAEATRSAVSQGSIFGAVALLIGAFAAWFGGRAGAVEPTVSVDRLRALARRALPRGT